VICLLSEIKKSHFLIHTESQYALYPNMQVIFVYNTFYREYVNIQYNLNLQGYQIFILSKNVINQLKTKMKEAARIQAEESSELLSSFCKNKASEQI